MDTVMGKITIGQTVDWYEALRDDVSGNSVRELFEKACNSAEEGEYVRNDTYFHALLLSEIMFSKTKKSLRIFSGRDIVRFLNALYIPFIKCCKTIALNGGEIKIVSIVPDRENLEISKQELLNFFARVKSDVSEINGKIFAMLKVAPPEVVEKLSKDNNSSLSHYIVADNMVRVESPHGVLDENHSASEIQAKVYFNAPNMAKEFVDSFDNIYSGK